MNFPIMPAQASRVAAQTDHLYWGLICLAFVTCGIVFGPLSYFLIRYRHGRTADRTPLHLPEIKIEATWTILPAIVFMGFYAWGARDYFIIEKPPENAMEVYVVGKQWMWKIQHPEGNREINELHLPAGSDVKLLMTSEDVIHSLFLPEFRLKMDVVPGRYTTEWLKPDKIGAYNLFCSEYCGTSHSLMIGKVIVSSPADYEAWLATGQPQTSLVRAGEALFKQLGCSGCHVGSSVVRAPPLQGVFGKPVPLDTHEIITADEGYIRDSILFPAKQIVAGYTNAMPSYEGKLSEEELLELVAYIKSLGVIATGSTAYP
jgi:cytochrome c oxidase subunit 2